MSRYRDSDDYEGDPEQILAWGRWKRNAEQVLKSKRGRKALADLREALLALPGKRLINGALCTVGSPEVRFPEVTGEEIAAQVEESAARWVELEFEVPADDAAHVARWMRQDRDEGREAYRKVAEREGEGCCGTAAYLWHQKVRAGMDPAEAFAALPSVYEGDNEDPMRETAELGVQAGLAYTLAWELAYRNDETYGAMTPEERYTAFLAWLDQQLAESAA
jgi:hypothetical protein